MPPAGFKESSIHQRVIRSLAAETAEVEQAQKELRELLQYIEQAKKATVDNVEEEPKFVGGKAKRSPVVEITPIEAVNHDAITFESDNYAKLPCPATKSHTQGPEVGCITACDNAPQRATLAPSSNDSVEVSVGKSRLNPEATPFFPQTCRYPAFSPRADGKAPALSEVYTVIPSPICYEHVAGNLWLVYFPCFWSRPASATVLK
jgi:hypothetical protein